MPTDPGPTPTAEALTASVKADALRLAQEVRLGGHAWRTRLTPPVRTAPDLATAVARAKVEIRADIANDVVPASVACFAELHEYVDANEYGGLCEVEGLDAHAFVIFANDVQAEVDAWLLAGRP